MILNKNIQENIMNKMYKLQKIINGVIRVNKKYKTLDIIDAIELNNCVNFAEEIYIKLRKELLSISNNEINEDICIDNLQNIIIKISTLISLYGCERLDDLIYVCLGSSFTINDENINKYNLLNNYASPTKYRTIPWKNINKKDEYIVKNTYNFECHELYDHHISNTNNNELDNSNFYNKIYGMKIVIHNINKQTSLLVYSTVDDMILNLIENKFVIDKLNKFVLFDNNNNVEDNIETTESYNRYIDCLMVKDILILSVDEIKNKYISIRDNYIPNLKNTNLSKIINKFIDDDIEEKREMLINLLLFQDEKEYQYLAYLLYDLLTNDIHGLIDTYEQTIIYNSFPWYIKKYFRDAMKETVKYTNKLTNIDINKIPLEQQICLMKTNDIVKEKAMLKLKEIKMKSEDTGSKARHFLDGLLKIPFGIHKEEEIFKLMRENNKIFSSLINELNTDMFQSIIPFSYKNTYTSIEIYKYFSLLKNDIGEDIYNKVINNNIAVIKTMKKPLLNNIYTILNEITKTGVSKKEQKLFFAEKSIDIIQNKIIELLKNILIYDNGFIILCDFLKKKNMLVLNNETSDYEIIHKLNESIIKIDNNMNKISSYINNVGEILDKSVYGHKKAKRQIERIIGQWINGDNTGYCFGFEGPPGVGKTSLAKKGIAECLKDTDGTTRPFAFIAIGGSSNSSTLDGHNYTYVGSSWGRIVDILMDTKIMNPIFFIDELDKVSKTENGKEIIGILTHLIDPTQNDSFQDKYFNGININLSKALFIFSYNDVDSIDRILLDRIHRIQFDNLSLEDKLIIVNTHILPEIYKKMGLTTDMVEFNNDVIEYIIQEYTSEPGVRKLKEIIFEIIGEINLSIVKHEINTIHDIPIKITIEEVKNKYLKERHEINHMKINTIPKIGVINGLWANSVGDGGVLHIETSFYPCNSFLELNLTGMQGDVMKESMVVAKSVAWSLLMKHNNNSVSELIEKFDKTKYQGLHIHVPEGATPKDGPSAGTAITIAMYSLFSDYKIKNEIAITGEICLQGNITSIGGLNLKILGGIKAGVKTFIFPKENEKDFNKFMDKYKNNTLVTNIKFIPVSHIEDVIPIVFEYN